MGLILPPKLYGICFYVGSYELLKETAECSNGHKICHGCQLEIWSQERNEYGQAWDDDDDDDDDADVGTIAAVVAAAAVVDDDDEYLTQCAIFVLSAWARRQNPDWLNLFTSLLDNAANSRMITRTIRVPSLLQHFRRYLSEVTLGAEPLQMLSAFRVTISAFDGFRYLPLRYIMRGNRRFNIYVVCFGPIFCIH